MMKPVPLPRHFHNDHSGSQSNYSRYRHQHFVRKLSSNLLMRRHQTLRFSRFRKQNYGRHDRHSPSRSRSRDHSRSRSSSSDRSNTRVRSERSFSKHSDRSESSNEDIRNSNRNGSLYRRRSTASDEKTPDRPRTPSKSVTSPESMISNRSSNSPRTHRIPSSESRNNQQSRSHSRERTLSHAPSRESPHKKSQRDITDHGSASRGHNDSVKSRNTGEKYHQKPSHKSLQPCPRISESPEKAHELQTSKLSTSEPAPVPPVPGLLGQTLQAPSLSPQIFAKTDAANHVPSPLQMCDLAPTLSIHYTEVVTPESVPLSPKHCGFSNGDLSKNKLDNNMTKKHYVAGKLSGFSAEKVELIRIKKEDIEQAYRQDCETFATVVKMLISKDPGLEDVLQPSLQQNLREIGERCIQELQDYVDQLRRDSGTLSK